uniref:C2H2-type domain-containing protein n=1 Tax=Oreochromis niloticus TaxID=8128 RepID=A0A669E8N7_ORENI
MAQLLPPPAEASCSTFSFPGKPYGELKNSMISQTPFGSSDPLMISQEGGLHGMTETLMNHVHQRRSRSFQVIKPKKYQSQLWTSGMEKSSDAPEQTVCVLLQDVKYHLSPAAGGASEQQGYTSPIKDLPFLDNKENEEMMLGDQYSVIGMQPSSSDITLTPEPHDQHIIHKVAVSDYNTASDRTPEGGVFGFNMNSSTDHEGNCGEDSATQNCFICSNCGQSFDSFDIFQRHQCEKITEQPFSCEICGKSFNQMSILKLLHKPLSGTARCYGCSQCGKSFSRLHQFKLHQQSHKRKRAFWCTVCGKSFQCSSHLSIHHRTHTGEKPYGCGQCGKRFTQQSSLRVHQRTHSGERPYSCSQCGKTFILMHHLKRHRIIHTYSLCFNVRRSKPA